MKKLEYYIVKNNEKVTSKMFDVDDDYFGHNLKEWFQTVTRLKIEGLYGSSIIKEKLFYDVDIKDSDDYWSIQASYFMNDK